MLTFGKGTILERNISQLLVNIKIYSLILCLGIGPQSEQNLLKPCQWASSPVPVFVLSNNSGNNARRKGRGDHVLSPMLSIRSSINRGRGVQVSSLLLLGE